MNKLAKRLLSIVCATVLTLPLLSSNTFASDISNSNEPTKLPIFEESNIGNKKLLKSVDNEIITITDKEQIADIAKQQQLEDSESITAIIYEFRNFSDIQESPPIEGKTNDNPLVRAVSPVVTVYNVKDLGTGYSYWDQYDSSLYGGPANVTKTYTRTASSSYSCSVTIDYEIIEAAVGFTFTSGQTVMEAYSFSVPANKTIELRVFTNYQKKSYDIGDNYGGLIYYTSSGTAQKPVGLIFQQIQR